MSKEFIEKGFNSSSISEAANQEMQLSYFTESKLQQNRLDPEYITKWAERKFQTNDYFLNWVKSIFRSENALSFYKYLRFPSPSTRLIKNKIEPQLKRVFNAEDSDFKYSVSNKTIADFLPGLDIKDFNTQLFQKLLYNHNSILVQGLSADEINTPIRWFVDIEDVISIVENNGRIGKIAYKTCLIIDVKKQSGILVIDSESYSFFDKDFVLLAKIDHDLGHTPCEFISPNRYKGDFVVRESIFTYVRGDLEEYVFLKTLQKMTEPNGAFPVVSKIAIDEEVEDIRGDEGQPSSDNIMGPQHARIFSQNETVGTGDLQAGMIHELPLEMVKGPDGSINMDIVKSYLNFYHLPVDILEYLNKRITQIEIIIISSIVGDVIESTEESKNVEQIEKAISVLENTLTAFAEALNLIRTISDRDMLSLQFGAENVNEVFIHYGTDFFLDSVSKLFEDLEKAPNQLERKNIIVRISQNRYKNNIDQQSRQKLLYDLIPYVSDKDFAFAQGGLDPTTKTYQLRFNYWIGLFEAQFGDIVTFFKNLDGEISARLNIVNNLVLEIINENTPEPTVKEPENINT